MRKQINLLLQNGQSPSPDMTGNLSSTHIEHYCYTVLLGESVFKCKWQGFHFKPSENSISKADGLSSQNGYLNE
jgi:hypothetical protein